MSGSEFDVIRAVDRRRRDRDERVEPVERTRVPTGSPDRVRHVVDALAATGVDWIKFRTLPSMAPSGL